ncbi:DUF4235 domain-containing protein [Thermostaphylospora chromogena]|uniref:DUF4235 domain-containing protein n=1 Tax=Thermostaphylospora chromogena TaxID=35622 RepID=A0A1H1DZL2_9ACTN|nr:DUF4235 domain-containing protein [Thermostaphylospora chromogena]SDQ81803.1 Protein of unknown function [Thermostaphylospora chromogena]
MGILLKPLSLLFGVLGGVIASALFKRIWKMATGDDDAPHADDMDRTWREVLVAATVHGAVFGLVKAAVDRAGKQGVRRVTGTAGHPRAAARHDRSARRSAAPVR